MFPSILTPELAKKLQRKRVMSNGTAMISLLLLGVSLFVPGTVGLVLLGIGGMGIITALILLSNLQKFEQKILLDHFRDTLEKGTPHGGNQN